VPLRFTMFGPLKLLLVMMLFTPVVSVMLAGRA
jgi:hypothetical protein